MTFLPQKGPWVTKRKKEKKNKNELSNEIYFKELVLLNKGLFKAERFVNLSACEHTVPQSPTAGGVPNSGALLNRRLLIWVCHSDLIESNQ